MKKIGMLIFSLLSLSALKAQNATEAVDAKKEQTAAEAIELKETVYDFGKIPQGKPVYHFFDVTNKTNAPLKLENVTASCGCTTPEWNREPIAAGSTEQIKVGYNAASEGSFEKYITITYNGNQTKQFRIKGTVWKAPVGSAPVNSSVNFLKHQIQ
jgi:hypothetical protein